MSNKSISMDFMQFFLPKKIANSIDFNTISLSNSSFINQGLSEFFSDSIFECKLFAEDSSLYISILLEHKSYEDELTSFQILDYLSNSYRFQIKQNEKFKLVIPVVFYHGNKKWDFKNINDFFSTYPIEFQQFLPNFEIIFIDLNILDDNVIDNIANILLRTAILVQKYSFNPKELEEKFIKILNTLYLADNRNLFHTFLVYIFQVIEIKEDKLVQILKDVPNNIKSEIMSTYEILIEKGIEKNKVETVINAFKNGISIQIIANITDLTIEKVEEILRNHKNS